MRQLGIERGAVFGYPGGGIKKDRLSAQKRFDTANQQESEWRAWLIAGLASHRLNNLDGAREQLSNAGNVLNGLEKRWGTDHFNTYLARPDVQFHRKQLDKARLTK